VIKNMATIEGTYTKIRPATRSHRNKFGNVHTSYDGVTWDSAGECERYKELKLIQKAGAIRDLRWHVRYELIVNEYPCGIYEADFVYWDVENDAEICEDYKGFRTPEYRLKKRLMWALFLITIKETGPKPMVRRNKRKLALYGLGKSRSAATLRRKNP